MFILLGIIVFIVAFIVLSLHPAERSYEMPKFRVCGKSFLSLLALLLCLVNGVKSIPTGHTGVVATFGKVEDYTLEAGIHFINYKVDIKYLIYAINISASLCVL